MNLTSRISDDRQKRRKDMAETASMNFDPETKKAMKASTENTK